MLLTVSLICMVAAVVAFLVLAVVEHRVGTRLDRAMDHHQPTRDLFARTDTLLAVMKGLLYFYWIAWAGMILGLAFR